MEDKALNVVCVSLPGHKDRILLCLLDKSLYISLIHLHDTWWNNPHPYVVAEKSAPINKQVMQIVTTVTVQTTNE